MIPVFACRPRRLARRRQGRRAGGCLLAVTALALGSASVASAHSAFLGSTPQPGQRLGSAPAQITLTFTEPLDRRLSTASLTEVRSGKRFPARVSFSSSRQLVLRPTRSPGRAAFRVDWHTVSTLDGHALEGSFSFGVGVAAAGGEHSVQQSPLARNGWLRILARVGLYTMLLLFAGALLLRAVLRPRSGWPVPERLALPDLKLNALRRRERNLVVDAGLFAAAFAALSAVFDAVDAGQGLSIRGLRSFLLENPAGPPRVATVVFILLAGLLARRAPRLAAVSGVLALGSIAFAGHASSASSRVLAVSSDWIHLVAAAVWLGGIAVIVLVWGPRLRTGGRALRLAVMRQVLAPFGRIALPAFLVVVVSGSVNALIELGSVSALWNTGYGQVLLVKISLVALIAGASFTHALQLRPRLLAANPHPEEQLERRHWQLLRSEPVLGIGVAGAVAVLVAFPLPPRQLQASDEATAAAPACNPCPLRLPKANELAVAEQGGSNIVAAWITRHPGGLTGEVHVLNNQAKPAKPPFKIAHASQRACGRGCATFTTPGLPATLQISLRERGHRYTTDLQTTWQPDKSPQARRWLNQTQATMRRLQSVREYEQIASVPGVYAITNYRLRAPDRFAYDTNLGGHSIVIGRSQWSREPPDQRWRRDLFGGGIAFSTRSWFVWTNYAQAVRLLGMENRAGRPTAVVGLMDPGSPAWWRLYIDLPTKRLVQDRLITTAHFMTQIYHSFNRPLTIRPPTRAGG